MLLRRTKVQFTGNPIKTDPMIKHIGAYVPLCVFSNITIYTLAKNWNKSSMISSILEKWMLEHFTPKAEAECIQIIVNTIYGSFLELNSTYKSTMTYSQFISIKVIKELEFKGLTKSAIKEILNGLDKFHANEQNRK
jgi:hypothetical protein